MTPDEVKMQARKIRLMKLGMWGAVAFAFIFYGELLRIQILLQRILNALQK